MIQLVSLHITIEFKHTDKTEVCGGGGGWWGVAIDGIKLSSKILNFSL